MLTATPGLNFKPPPGQFGDVVIEGVPLSGGHTAGVMATHASKLAVMVTSLVPGVKVVLAVVLLPKVPVGADQFLKP